MSSRRVALADNPNAVNSPLRVQATKRPRALINDTQNFDVPQKKRRVVDSAASNTNKINQHDLDTRTLTRLSQSKAEKISLADKESIKQWRRHYRKVFPSFVFYFESVSQDVHHRACKQIALLGAREEKFFSRNVTHIVTTRSIPSSTNDQSNTEQPPTIAKQGQIRSQQMKNATINPSLLDRMAEAYANTSQSRSKTIVDATTSRRTQDVEIRRSQNNAADVLQKAKDMNMKIWALEKFDRMMSTMFCEDLLEESNTNHHIPSKNLRGVPVASRETDLSQLLRQEKQNAVIDRQPWQDIVPFKGFFVYVHDMDERVKPIMVREYAKPDPQNYIEEGEWPMLHMVSMGRCPFLPEPPSREDRPKISKNKKEAKKQQDRHRIRPEDETQARGREPITRENVRQTRSTTRSPQKPVLCELDVNNTSKPLMPAPSTKSFAPPKLIRPTTGNPESMPPTLGHARADFRGIACNPGGEPLASGMRANVTSAIRSQMISSAAVTAPGSRAGTSKQMHHLQRQVLDKHSGVSGNSVPSSYINDVRAAINEENATSTRRTTRKKGAETMTRIYEDETLSENEDTQTTTSARSKNAKKKAQTKKEPKPGYCENCREKYDDFNEHIETKIHKKFALNSQNWMELDALLVQLERR